MTSAGETIWTRLEECVQSLSEPFRASEIIGWFRRHYPDVKEQSLRAHIQGATSNASLASRGTFAGRAPLITRIDHGLYRRAPASARRASPEGEAPEGTQGSGVKSESPRDEWHQEAHVQAAVVTHLATTGWQITSVADTATKERGIDIVARRAGDVIGVEVKGFPSRFYADPARAGHRKPTQPATQARVWYASAMLAAMRLRTREPSMISVMALPDFQTYRSLVADTRWSLERCEIRVWWVSDNGAVVEQ